MAGGSGHNVLEGWLNDTEKKELKPQAKTARSTLG